MFSVPNEELRLIRWNNAVNLTKKFIKYCNENNYSFMLDNSTILTTDHIEISEDKILVLVENGNQTLSYTIYDNTAPTSDSARSSTNYWFIENILFNSKLIRQIYDAEFIHTIQVDRDTILRK